jgi:mannose-6-phosphate isomerase-like protein (cupin superfamily)
MATQLISKDSGPSANVTPPAFPALTQIDPTELANRVREDYRNFPLLKVNGHCIRLAVMTGEYRWHRHTGSDECFLVLEGELEIDFEHSPTVVLKPGRLFSIPAGVRHRTRARVRTVNLCFEDERAYTDVVFED